LALAEAATAPQIAAFTGHSLKAETISFDWIESQRTLRMRVDQDQARLLGVSSQVLAQSISLM
jgi:multidrug efflux pump subunit AcrB